MRAVCIPLTRGQRALVDEEDYERLAPYRWRAVNRANRSTTVWKAVTSLYMYGKQPNRSMHQMILQVVPPLEVDHINGDPLDNRKCNLRICTHAQNQHNQHRVRANATSRYKGVSRNPKSGKFIVQIGNGGKSHNIGSYDDEIDAALAYNNAAWVFFREYARPNEIEV